MKIIGIIPARFASTRFPGKPLADILGKPMIQRVYERALMSERLHDVIVATDDTRIYDCVMSFGGHAVMTDSNLPNGTARCEEALRIYGDDSVDAVINIQGDEPLMNPVMIDEIAELLSDNECVTLCRELDSDFENPNVVKVVMSQDNNALYFSRSLIPYKRNESSLPVYYHIGIYGYTVRFLKEYVSLSNTPLSDSESLEQLKILEHGRKIYVKVTQCKEENIGVDTTEDLERVRRILKDAGV